MEAGLQGAIGQPVAAWAVLAGGLSVGLLTGNGDWRTLILCILLADGLWGGIWRGLVGLSAIRTGGEGQAARRPWLPYLQPGSPAARLLGWGEPGEMDHNLRAALPMLLAALLLAAVLGIGAVVLTGVFVLVAGFGWVSQHNRQIPVGLLHSIATILLPWAVVLLALGGENMGEGSLVNGWTLALLWSLHSWGAGRLTRGYSARSALPLMAVAQAGIGLLLILAQAPLWIAVLAVLWLPAWLTVIQGEHPRRVNVLWTISMLVSAAALAMGG